jgi:hypothetical protein
VKSAFPGPGQYDIDAGYNKIMPRTTSVPVSKVSKEVDFDNKVPGVGSYNNDSLKVKQNNPKFSVGKTGREDPFLPENYKKQIENIPGPGNYNLNSSIGDGRKTSVRGKPKDDPDNGVPGPGAYNEVKDKVLLKSPGWE